MSGRRLAGELEHVDATGARRALPRRADSGAGPNARRGPDPRPLERSMLDLQSKAGNAAVRAALGVQPSVQRQKPPKFVTEGQAELKALFPNEKLMQGVIVKDYAALNATLQGAYGAWTQSGTEIYIQDPDNLEGVTATNRRSMLRYILQHEAHHVRQFAKAGGPPRKWQTMVQHEIEAYEKDKVWLAANKAAFKDRKLHATLLKGATHNHKVALDLLWAAADVPDSERFLYDSLKREALIPSGATRNPLDLYKQP